MGFRFMTRPTGRFYRALLLAAFLALAAAPVAQAAQQVITSPGPLTRIVLGDRTNCQVNHQADGNVREFFPSGSDEGACGTFLLLNGTTRYTPANVPAGFQSIQVPWTIVSQSGVMGSGTTADPYRVVTTVDAGTSGVRVEQTDSYVVGEESYQTDIRVINNSSQAANVRLWRAGDCFLGGSDFGYGKVDGESIACAASLAPDTRILQWVPLTSGSNYYQAHYSEVWSRIGQNQPFNDTCECTTFQDNGAGLSWDFIVPAGGAVTQSHLTNFSPTGREPITISKTADSSTSPPGGLNGYTVTINNPNTAPVTGDFVDTLPNGFSYVPGSATIGGAPEPTVNGQQLTFSNVTVPANGSTTFHFNVTVATAPGTYYNEVDGTINGYTVIGTGPTAPITVALLSVPGRMVSNATRSGATFASIVDCDAATANSRSRPFQIRWSGQTFRATLYLNVVCFDNPAFTPSPPPATMAFDTQIGTAAGTLNGAAGYTLEWQLEDHGAPSPMDAAFLRVTRNSDGAVILDIPLGPVSSGQIYALPPV